MQNEGCGGTRGDGEITLTMEEWPQVRTGERSGWEGPARGLWTGQKNDVCGMCG